MLDWLSTAHCFTSIPQWGTVLAEIRNPQVGAQGYQMFPFLKVWSRKIACITGFANSQGLLIFAFLVHCTSFFPKRPQTKTEMSGTLKRLTWVVFRPDITETVDWSLTTTVFYGLQGASYYKEHPQHFLKNQKKNHTKGAAYYKAHLKMMDKSEKDQNSKPNCRGK